MDTKDIGKVQLGAPFRMDKSWLSAERYRAAGDLFHGPAAGIEAGMLWRRGLGALPWTTPGPGGVPMGRNCDWTC